MPVSKKRKKHGRPVGSRRQQLPALVQPDERLTVAPWRAYLQAAAAGLDAGGLQVLAQWPYRVVSADGAGDLTSIARDAQGLGQTVDEVVENAVWLEDQGLLTWDVEQQAALLTMPAEGLDALPAD